MLRRFVRRIPEPEGDLPRGALQLREEHGLDAPVGDALKVIKRADRPGHIAGIVVDRNGDAPVADLAFLVVHGVAAPADERDIVVPGYENGFFVGSTILDPVTPDMAIGQREIFGPVTLIKRVKTFEEGLAVMNANPFANGSAIFTQSGYYARQFEMLTDGGMVGINVGIPVPSAYFPFSGNKDSFFGDQHVLGLDGVRFYTRAKTVTRHWYDEHSRKKAIDTWEGTVERN